MRVALFGKDGQPLTEAAAHAVERAGLDLIRFHGAEVEPWLRGVKPDVLLSAGYGKILSAEALRLPRIGALNVHPSLLPDYKGSYPVFWAFYDRQEQIGVTIHKMLPEVDAGDVVAQAPFPIDPTHEPVFAYQGVIRLGAQMLERVLRDLTTNGGIDGVPQPPGGCFRGVPWRELDRLAFDWTLPADEIARRYRIFPEWVHVATRGGRVFAHDVTPVAGRGGPGQILRRGVDSVTIQTADGAIRLRGLRRRDTTGQTDRLRSLALGLRLRAQ